MNRAGLDMIGADSLDQVKGLCVYPLVVEEYREAFKTLTQDVFKGESRSLEFKMINLNGRPLWLFTHAIPLRNEKGEIVSSLASTINITVRKQGEMALRKSEARLQSILRAVPVGIGVVVNRVIVEVNSRICEMTGRSRDELVGKSARVLYPTQEEFEFVGREKYLQIAERGVGTVESRWIRKDGSILNVLLSSSPINPDDLSAGVTFTAIDITERKKAEEALAESERNYRNLFDSSTDGIFILDLDGSFIDANRTAYERLGYSREEFLSLHIIELDDPINAEFVPERMKQIREQGSAVFESSNLRKDGSKMPVEVNARLLEYNGKQVYFSVIRDITERKKAEEALRENKERLDLALQSAHMGVWRWEIKENRRYFDNLTCHLLGITPATFTGTAEEFFQTVHPEDREKIKAELARTIEQDVLYEPKYRVVWPDGSVHYITARGRLVRDEMGQPARINGILWDITDQLLLEQERMKTQKIESLGTLAGGIAHDFNNLLQGIFGYISMAKLTLDQKEKSLEMLEEAEKALHMTVNLTSQLLTFSKGGKPVKKMISLQPVIENSAKFALSGSPVDYRIMLDQDLWTVEADEGQIGQVIQNIVLNADQAMPLGGTIRITAKNVREPKKELPQVLREGKYVEISVKDSGIGISQQYLQKIFEPYFTTKEKGSGLGLATSYSIIRNHGGVINVNSKVGKGSTFYIYLPALEGGKEVPQVGASVTVGQKGKILLMDDEELIRNSAGEMLKVLQHEVDFAEHGEEAIGKYQTARESGKPFDIVILDLTIRGGMGGKETIERLCAIDPGIKAIVSSGYSDDAVVADYKKYGFKACLTKPYRLKDLRDTLHALLSA